MKIIIETLGCKMNFVDSERLAKELAPIGFEVVPADCKADFALLNTCTVTENADRKSLSELRRLTKKAEKLIVMGCGARVSAKKIQKAFPKALICRSGAEVVDFLRPFATKAPKPFVSARTRAFIEIQTGCDTYCAFCIVPFARGASASRPQAEIIAEIQEKEREGFKEVVLTGINLAAWGASNTNRPQESRFGALLQAILAETKIPRVRISSVGAQFLNADFFAAFRDERICDYLHISIQSGSESVLKQMKRGHGISEIIAVAEKARAVRPDVALTADIIVGFPGETEEDFAASVALAQQIGLAKIHVFPFSPRHGTVAAALPPLPAEVVRARAERLRAVGENLRERFITAQIGKERAVLFENLGEGLTGNYLRVWEAGVAENTLKKVVLTMENLIS